MTLGDFFEACSTNPAIILFYFVAVPLTALLAWIFGRDEGDISPWKYLYTVLMYLACVPGIFAVTLNVYLFLFERQGIMETNIFTQILPIFSMLLTLFLIRLNVSLDEIPGFGKLTGLLMMITVLLSIMWILDRTHVIAFTYIPFVYIILILIGLLVLARFGWKKVME